MRIAPKIEFKSIDVDGTWPLPVLTSFEAVGVVRLQTFERDNPARTITENGIAWRRSDDSREPGVIVDDMDGITAGAVYTSVLMILGRRD